MIREAADGTTEIAACLFWIVRQTVIFRPFQSAVALAMSSPTFLGDWKEIFELIISLWNYVLPINHW